MAVAALVGAISGPLVTAALYVALEQVIVSRIAARLPSRGASTEGAVTANDKVARPATTSAAPAASTKKSAGDHAKEEREGSQARPEPTGAGSASGTATLRAGLASGPDQPWPAWFRLARIVAHARATQPRRVLAAVDLSTEMRGERDRYRVCYAADLPDHEVAVRCDDQGLDCLGRILDGRFGGSRNQRACYTFAFDGPPGHAMVTLEGPAR